jgi:hypothetical protein
VRFRKKNETETKSNKHIWMLGEPDSSMRFALGTHVSFIMYINSVRFLILGPLLILLALPLWMFPILFSRPQPLPQSLETISIGIPLFLVLGFFLGYMFFLKDREFNGKNGRKIFFSSMFFRFPISILIGLIIFIPLIFAIDASIGYYVYHLPFMERFLSGIKTEVFMFYVPFFIFILFLWMFFNLKIGPKDYTTYAIKIMKGNISFLNKKSKLYHTIRLIYQRTKIEMKNRLGENAEKSLKIENILRLANLVETLDKDDTETTNLILSILHDLEQTDWNDNTIKYREIMDRINSVTSNLNIEINELTKNITRQRIKQYVFLIITIASFSVNSFTFLFHKFYG